MYGRYKHGGLVECILPVYPHVDVDVDIFLLMSIHKLSLK